MAEVHGVGTSFEYIDDDHVFFKGQLKTRGLSDTVNGYAIRSLVPSSRLIAAFDRLVSLRAPMEPEDVNRLLAKPLSTELPLSLKAFKAATGIQKYKDMRDIYAARVLEFKPVTMTPNAFLSGCMGHGDKDDNTANTYQKLRLV
jgi:hypothetical protein